MLPSEILELVTAQPGLDDLALSGEAPSDPFVLVPAEKLREIAFFLRDRDELLFDYLRCLSGVDLTESMAVVYHLYSLTRRHSLVVKVVLSRDEPVLDSVQDIWTAANWYEREAWDLLGIRFAGHPCLERIMLPPDWVGHPLRKDYEMPDNYHGISTGKPAEPEGEDA